MSNWNDQSQIAQFAAIRRRVLSKGGTAVNVAISASATSAAVTLLSDEPDTGYGVVVSPSWMTGVSVHHKTPTGFTVEFSTAAPVDSTFDYFVFRSERMRTAAITGGGGGISGGGGGVSDGDKGDITVSGTGTVWTIDNDAVTYAKIQNVSATDRLLGRSTAGAGNIEEIVCTAAGRAILDDADAAAQRTTLGAAATSHTHVKADITDFAHTHVKADITDFAHTHVAADVTDLGALATLDTVGTAQIDDDAVTYAKLQNVSATQRLLGRNTAGAGNVEELDTSTPLDWLSSTRGTILYRGASGWAGLVPGTSGHFLKTQGVGADPIWDAAPGGGGGVSDGDKGDITVTGTGATWTIDNDVVTFAKMQNIVTDRLIGRDTAATGDPEEISVSGGIEFTGSGGIQTSAFTGDVTKSAGGTALTVANDAVTFAKMQNIATDRLVGRDTASSGDPEEIALAGSLVFTGSQSIQLSGDSASPGNTKLYGTDGSGVKGWYDQPAGGGGGGPSYVKMTADQSFTTTTLADVTGMSFAVTSGVYYRLRFTLMFQSTSTSVGIILGCTGPTVTQCCGRYEIHIAVSGTDSVFVSDVVSLNSSVTGTAVSSTGANKLATIEMIFVPSADGTVQLQGARETNTGGATLTLKQGSMGSLETLP